ncbi:class I SAM-dependent methyltransferase [Nafulsella turpanensis]|uniref:class I SAM-dependent methyltransferase n=1 Tax=Nafulsella turpanensis TaxID=1265690 RepID=UPI00034DE37D|nr:class I SAM-dependent methyltransferase [Nafulsella turpanensis]
MLQKDILLKHNGKVYKGCNGYQRIELIESVNELCRGIEQPKVLEAGCGSGLNIYLLESLNSQIEIHGFEYTNARIASAIVNLFYSPNLHNLFLADVCNLKIPDNSFDVVYSNHVLEQLGQERAEAALKEMWRVCKKGIVVSEPSIHGANRYEKWRMNTLGYCRDLYSVAKKLPHAKVLVYKEDSYRTYPNTSHHLVVEKTP